MSMKKTEGGVTAAKGFLAASTAAGIKKNGSMDMAMIYSEVPCVVAGTFTTKCGESGTCEMGQEARVRLPHCSGGSLQQWNRQRLYRD